MTKLASTYLPELLYFALTYGVTKLVTALEEELIHNISKCSHIAYRQQAVFKYDQAGVVSRVDPSGASLCGVGTEAL